MSPRFSLDFADVWKGLRGSLLVFIGAFVVGGLVEVNAQLEAGQLALGTFEILRPLLIAGASFLMEEARRFFRNYENS